MKKYRVEVPIRSCTVYIVEASNAKEAKELAREATVLEGFDYVTDPEEDWNEDFSEIGVYEHDPFFDPS